MRLAISQSRRRKQQDPESSSGSDFELDKSRSEPTSHLGSSSDTEVEEELDSDTEVEEDADSEGNFLRQRMAFHKSQGRAKSKRGDWANALVAHFALKWRSQTHPILGTHPIPFAIARPIYLRPILNGVW